MKACSMVDVMLLTSVLPQLSSKGVSKSVLGVTLTRYMMEMTRANPHLAEMESLMNSPQTACKTIESLINRAAITQLTGLYEGGGSINVQGEEQKQLDVLTNDVSGTSLG